MNKEKEDGKENEEENENGSSTGMNKLGKKY